MKKVLMILLTLALVFSMAGIVSAGTETVLLEKAQVDATLAGKGITVVTYGVSSSYSLEIPVNFEFDNANDVRVTSVKVSDVTITTHELLNVTVSSTHGWNLVEHVISHTQGKDYDEVDDPHMLSYSLTFNNGVEDVTCNNTTCPIGTKVDVLTVESGTTSGETQLTFTLSNDAPQAAGIYVDKIEFNSKIYNID